MNPQAALLIAATFAACMTPATYATPITCDTSVADACSGSNADCPTPDGELDNPGNCGDPNSGYVECSGWTIITDYDMFGSAYYFKDGAFVAQISFAPEGFRCFVGPPSFAAPSCPDAEVKTLPACQ